MSAPLDPVFNAIANLQVQRMSAGVTALSSGTQSFQKGEYSKAILDFRRALAYDPTQIDAYRLMGKAYTALGQTDNAIQSYQRAVHADASFTDARNDLAYAYLDAKRNSEAEKEFKTLLQQQPRSAGVAASLGYLYMNTGRMAEAETQLTNAISYAPSDPAAHYSLGLLLNQQGRFSEAAGQLGTAISLRPSYAAAIAELGRSYFGMGDTDRATDQANRLDGMGTSESAGLANGLRQSMYLPRLMFADTTRSTFKPLLGPNTPLSQLDPSLATPGAVKTFTISFQFNQAMDLNSVQNVFNWNISKAAGGTGGAYNNGANLNASQQQGILPFPISVSYDPNKMTATVTFAIGQNAAGNGVIDPSHWVFRFGGMAADGTPMDPKYDQYDGYLNRPY